MIQFPFQSKVSERFGLLLFPVARVLLSHGQKAVAVDMIVDSGADISIVYESLGKYPGFAVKEGEEISTLGGIGGEVPCLYRELGMQIGDISFPSRVAWVLSNRIPPILGRADVFDRFDIEMRQKERITIFREKKHGAKS